MSQDQSLILLTSRFPYSPGEEFIYNELLILAEKFKKVTIVPTNQECWNIEREHNRDLPSNVNVHIIKSNIKKPLFRKANSILFSMTNPNILNWYKRDLENAKRFGLKGKFKLYKWIVDAYQIRKNIEGIEAES